MRTAAIAHAVQLTPATAARRGPSEQRMLHVDRKRGRVVPARLSDVLHTVEPGDLWVLNDAATIPASLRVRVQGRALEIRLAQATTRGTWWAVLFGEGSWRDDTDLRPAPPSVSPGEALGLEDGSALTVVRAGRLIEVRFPTSGDAFWQQLYRLGRPVQYSYHTRPLPLSEVQTPYAARPWALELPSAGRPLTTELLGALRRRGVELSTLTHAAGLSATGDPALDRSLPLPERFHIPARTADAVRRAKDEGRRVVAVGTSVTRALEGVVRERGRVVQGEGETSLKIGRDTSLAIVDALLTGAHDPMSSHHALLEAFAPRPLLTRALSASVRHGYRGHELGDSWLIT
ncbi:MAG: S-adenosylmethionine:tRNA ribosyltransferase-isomerase [Sandaracinaceae bacterium]